MFQIFLSRDNKLNLATVVEGDLKVPFSIATTPGLLYFPLDTYLGVLSAKQSSIKYHFLSLWYDSTWNWIPVSWTICEHSTHSA